MGQLLTARAVPFTAEQHDDSLQRREVLVLALLAGAFFHLALIIVTGLVAAATWDTPYRGGAFATLAVLYLACGGAVLASVRKVFGIEQTRPRSKPSLRIHPGAIK